MLVNLRPVLRRLEGAMKNERRRLIGGNRFIAGDVSTKLNGFSVNANARYPSFIPESHAFESGRARRSDSGVSGVLGMCSKSEIGDSIIGFVAVDVIDETSRPSAVMKRPGHAMGHYLPIRNLASQIARWRAERSKLSCVRDALAGDAVLKFFAPYFSRFRAVSYPFRNALYAARALPFSVQLRHGRYLLSLLFLTLAQNTCLVKRGRAAGCW